MTKRTRRALALLLGVLMAAGGCGMIWKLVEYRQGESTYAEAAQLAQLPDLDAIAPAAPRPAPEKPVSPPAQSGTEQPQQEAAPEKEAPVWVDPYADALRNMDFAALRQANEDVLGWIVIPGTRLSYPLVQGEDNDYYLNRTWRRSRNSIGAIFVDYRCDGGLEDFHTIIYGHRMNDRSMFGQLLNYKDPQYLADHPCIYIADDNGSHTYEIFAVYEAVSNHTYMLEFEDHRYRQAFLDYCLSKSMVDTGVIPETDDHILTLSTCTGRGHDTRWVVQAVRRGAQEEPAQETAAPPAAPAPTPEPPSSQDIPSQDIPSQDIRD